VNFNSAYVPLSGSFRAMGSKGLADYLKETGVVRTRLVYKAFVGVDRREFVPEEYRDMAYVDEALPIGHGQTISQPYTVAFMLELLKPQPGQKILDVGSGSGWTTALLAHVVGAKGAIFGVELVPELVEYGKRNLKKFSFPWATIQQAKPKAFGLPEHAPYDRILVSAAATEVPGELLKQLHAPGRLVIPIGSAIMLFDKDKNGNVQQQRHEGFVFVPLLE
jgi:protein-L-isoaspartate(D-aspartate) O-methyltransferase